MTGNASLRAVILLLFTVTLKEQPVYCCQLFNSTRGGFSPGGALREKSEHRKRQSKMQSVEATEKELKQQ